MKTYVIVITVALALSGCGRGRTNQQQTSATTAGNTVEESMTIVGCLVPAGETPESRAVGTSGNPQPPSFTLVNVTTPVKDSGGPTFGLVANEDRLADLQRFANSRVEVTGSIMTSTGDTRRLRVTDVRQLEPTCGASRGR